jgi:hypothetical protein
MLKFIPTASSGVRQTFGKFGSILKPGVNVYFPIAQQISNPEK